MKKKKVLNLEAARIRRIRAIAESVFTNLDAGDLWNAQRSAQLVVNGINSLLYVRCLDEMNRE